MMILQNVKRYTIDAENDGNRKRENQGGKGNEKFYKKRYDGCKTDRPGKMEVCGKKLAAICGISAAGAASYHYLQVSADGRRADRV